MTAPKYSGYPGYKRSATHHIESPSHIVTESGVQVMHLETFSLSQNELYKKKKRFHCWRGQGEPGMNCQTGCIINGCYDLKKTPLNYMIVDHTGFFFPS